MKKKLENKMVEHLENKAEMPVIKVERGIIYQLVGENWVRVGISPAKAVEVIKDVIVQAVKEKIDEEDCGC